jgi:hypothetical protein
MNTRFPAKFAPRLFSALLAPGLAASAMAQSQSGADGLLNDHWVINLGGFFLTTDTRAGLNGRSSINPDIDFEREFGKAADSRQFRADALWRITPAHHLRLMYFDNSTTRSRALERDLQWGDYTFVLGATAAFEQKTKVFELAYEYAFVRRPTYEVAAAVGVHYMDTTLQLTGTASFTGPAGNTTTASATSKTSSLPAPLPVIGLRAGWVLHPDWYLDAQAQFFKVRVDEYDGRWSDLRAGATWMFKRNFGLGLGYNVFATTLDVTKNDFDGRLRTGYSGLQAYLTGTF